MRAASAARRLPRRAVPGFTLVEALIGGALFLVVLGALLYTMSGSRRSSELASLYLTLMENVALAMHQLRSDMRQLSFVPNQAIIPYSLAITDDPDPAARSLRLRRSTPVSLNGGVPGSAFVYVEYRLVPADGRANRHHLSRTEWTASGARSGLRPQTSRSALTGGWGPPAAGLPGATRSRDTKVFRSFTLEDASFLYKEDNAIDSRVLHVALRVVSDTGRVPDWGPFREKSMVVTNVLQVQRPEPAFGWPSLFAEPVLLQAERPPCDVLAPAARDAAPVPDLAAAD
jgi:type II secretory pathway component PulJ